GSRVNQALFLLFQGNKSCTDGKCQVSQMLHCTTERDRVFGTFNRSMVLSRYACSVGKLFSSLSSLFQVADFVYLFLCRGFYPGNVHNVLLHCFVALFDAVHVSP
ncbi:hypothetical protein CHARACLAT_012042, partial [Characodon lateralis]|nr:hypothetical protein [Characodon lateralis]